MPRKKNLPLRPEGTSDYSQFLHGITLVALGLKACSATIEREAYATLMEKRSAVRGISTNYKLLESRRDYFNVSASFTLTVESASSKPSPSLSIKCTYEAHFHCDERDVRADLAQRFADSDVRVIVWPYFRQLVNDISARMAIPPILIPFSAATQNPSAR